MDHEIIITTTHFQTQDKDINKIINTYTDTKARYAAYTDDVLLRKITFELMHYNNDIRGTYLDDAGILLRLGMNTLTLTDFMNTTSIVAIQLLDEGRSMYFRPYDLANAIIGQIMSNIPADIRDNITPETKAALFNYLNNLQNTTNRNTYEYFTNKQPIRTFRGLNDVYKQLRENSNALTDKNDMPLYIPSESELHKYYETNGKGIAITNGGETPLLARYVDNDPVVVQDANRRAYVFDELSGSLQEIDPNMRGNKRLLSKADVERIFKKHDLSPAEYKKIFNELP